LTQPGIIAGDIYVRIKIKRHGIFQRRGADLVIIKKISLLEALTGVTMDIKHLDGNARTIATAPGEVLNHQELKTVKGMGLPYYKDPMSHGHLYI
jgi:DnaJ homolog subfamily A member 2